MDRGHQLDHVLRAIKKKLHPLGIQVEITIHDDETVTLSAKKQMGLSVQHASVHSTNLIDALWELIKYIEDNIEQWVGEATYGQ